MFKKLDLTSHIPVYRQLINSIEAGVKDGSLKGGYHLPSMNELAARLDISRETVKKAYSVLRDRGVIESIQGKGFYIAARELGKPKILMLFDKLSTYKDVLFSSFSSTIGNGGEVEIRLHGQQIDLFEYYMDERLGHYDYYVVTPHIPLNPAIQKRGVKALKRIPNRKLILMDRYLDSLSGNFGAAYQDFSNDIYEGLLQGLKKLRMQKQLNVITETSSLYHNYICDGVRRFCKDYGIKGEFYSGVTKDIIREKEVYLILNSQLDNELIEVATTAKEKKMKVGRDIGIISYNESPINAIVLNGLTTVSTDFREMGEIAARMILDKELRKVKCSFRMIRRSTF